MRAPIALAAAVAAVTVALAPAAEARTCDSEVDFNANTATRRLTTVLREVLGSLE